MSRSSDTPRLPFDPGRVRGENPAENAPALAAEAAITVSQLTSLIKGAIARAFPADLRVIGEISNLSKPSGGHIYFTLKDSASEVRCVMWRSSAASLKFDLSEGMEVIATGGVDVYEPRGQYQLYVRRMSPVGIGALELAFQQLKERLSKDGLFDAGRKRPLPAFPRCVAVVTSPTGAAIRDILQTIERRFAKMCVLVFGVRVQGEGAAEEIADAIRRINASSAALGGIDVMIVGRGGGSLEDLWAFNEEVVARAIYASEIPVVSAVGHEVDFTIADFVADVRAATPTAAAELVAPNLADLVGAFDSLEHRLRQSIRRKIESCRLRLSSVERSPWFRDPALQVRRVYQRLDELLGRLRLSLTRRIHDARRRIHDLEVRFSHGRPALQLARRRERASVVEWRLQKVIRARIQRIESLLRSAELRLVATSPKQLISAARQHIVRVDGDLHRAILRAIADRGGRLGSIEARLNAASHEQVLARGFSITRLVRGDKVVRSPGEVAEGDKISTETADGRFTSRVIDGNQGDLFD